jgi:hypothetical protein
MTMTGIELLDELTAENAKRYAEATDKLCFCADTMCESVDSPLTARYEDLIEALAIRLGYM